MKNNLVAWWKIHWVSFVEICLISYVVVILLLEMQLFFPAKSITEVIESSPKIESLGSVNLIEENGILFNNPAGFAGDENGSIYFAWWDYPELTKISINDPNSTSNWDVDSTGQFPFINPAFVIIEKNEKGENVWLLDAGNGWIYQIDYEGKLHAKINAAEWGVYNPQGLALDSDGNIYLADTGGSRILKSDANGNLVAEWGSLGKHKNQLNDPKGMVIWNDSLFVVDSNNNRIVEINLTGKWINSWNIDEGSYDIAIDTEGRLFLLSRQNNEIQVYSTEGSLISVIRPEDLNETDQEILGISISANKNIYIMTKNAIILFRVDWN